MAPSSTVTDTASSSFPWIGSFSNGCQRCHPTFAACIVVALFWAFDTRATQAQESQSGAVPAVSVEQLRAQFESRSFPAGESPDSAPLAFRMLRPQKVEAGQTYPLVVFLHGAGERGSDNAAQLKHSVHEFARTDRNSQYPAFVIAPQCPKDARWVEIDWSEKSGVGSFPEQPSPVIAQVMALVDSLIESEPIDPSRIYFTGLSMGGYGTWYAAARWPDRVAAAVPVCGGGDPQWAAKYNGVPIWAFHGDVDTAVPVGRSREMVSAIVQAGHAPEIRYTEYPGVAHDSWTQSYTRDDLFSWLFSQHR